VILTEFFQLSHLLGAMSFTRFQSLLCPRAVGGMTFILALIVRLVFADQWHATPYGMSPQLDALAYNDWAINISHGHVLHGRVFYQSPLYPYLLGIIYTFLGPNLWFPSLFNVLVSAVTCSLLSCLAFAAFGPWAAVTTGVLAAFYRPAIFYTAPVMKESLVLFLLACFAFKIFRARAANRTIDFLYSGVFLGLCAIARGNVLVLVPIIPLLLLWKRPQYYLKNGLVFVLGCCLAILPVTLHNMIVGKDLVLLSYADGFNAYIGHGPAATGTSYVFPPGVTSNPAEEEFDVSRIASQAVGHDLKPSEVSAWWRHQALIYALENPAHELRLLKAKVITFWSNDEPFDNYNISFIEHHFTTLLSWPLVGFGLVTSLAVFAMGASPQESRGNLAFFIIFVLVYMLSLMPFYVTDRYRLPVIVFLLPLAGAATPAAYWCYSMKEVQRFSCMVLIAVCMLGLTLWPTAADSEDEAFNWGVLCSIYENQGFHIAAIEAMDQAVTVNPHKVGVDALINTAQAMDFLGRRAEAENFLQRATSAYVLDGSLYYNIGRMKYIDGDYVSALSAFQKTIELSPTFALGYRGLAAIYDHFDERDKALEITKQGLKIVPLDPSLTDVLDQLQLKNDQ
jgi:tetratricopeptide (TPR) repeat protein